MRIIELTKENLEKTIAENDIVLIDFWAEWCGPCKVFGPVFAEAAEKYRDLVFAKCNTDEQREVAKRFRIMSIPTLAIFREEVLVFLQPGAMHGPGLDSLIEQVRGLNMEEIHAEIAEQRAKASSVKQET